MLGPKSHADQAGGDALQERHPREKTDRPGGRERRPRGKHAAQDAILDRDLKPLRGAGREHAPALDRLQVIARDF
jgi:hypothetical protein